MWIFIKYGIAKGKDFIMDRRGFIKLVGAAAVAPVAAIGCDPVVALGDTTVSVEKPKGISLEELRDIRKKLEAMKYHNHQIWEAQYPMCWEVVLDDIGNGLFNVRNPESSLRLSRGYNKSPFEFDAKGLDRLLGPKAKCTWQPLTRAEWLKKNTK